MTSDSVSSLDYPGKTKSRTVRFLIVPAAGVLIFWLFRVFVVQGYVFPIRIAGDSMAPTMLGDHLKATCERCRMPVRYRMFSGDDFVCPNCGQTQHSLAGKMERGDRVLINRFRHRLRTPARWDVVALREPENGAFVVKRLVGFAGEEITFRNGDLWVNGRISRKPIKSARSMAIKVHDDCFRGIQSRWQTEHQTGWAETAGGFRYQPPNAGSAESDWLTYRHLKSSTGPGLGELEVPISDNYAYNQGLSRKLNRVTDTWLELQCHWPLQKGFSIRGHDGFEFWQLDIEPKQLVLSRADKTVAVEDVEVSGGSQHKVEFGFCDHQAFVAIDQSVTIQFPYSVSQQPRPISRPWSIASNEAIEIHDLVIWRDIYHTASLEPAGHGRGNGYFLIGDNVPVSRDSRHELLKQVNANELLGTVVLRDDR